MLQPTHRYRGHQYLWAGLTREILDAAFTVLEVFLTNRFIWRRLSKNDAFDAKATAMADVARTAEVILKTGAFSVEMIR